MTDRWLDAAGVGEMLTFSAKYVRDCLAPSPGFPVAARVSKNGQLRWLESEVRDWMLANRERNRRAA